MVTSLKTAQLFFLIVFVLLVSGCTMNSAKEKLQWLDDKIGEGLEQIETSTSSPHTDVDIERDNEEMSFFKDGKLTQDAKNKIDKWLEDNNLNRYGDKQDTFYTGGTPLFNEATGESIDRFDYIMEKHPDILEKIK